MLIKCFYILLWFTWFIEIFLSPSTTVARARFMRHVDSSVAIGEAKAKSRNNRKPKKPHVFDIAFYRLLGSKAIYRPWLSWLIYPLLWFKAIYLGCHDLYIDCSHLQTLGLVNMTHIKLRVIYIDCCGFVMAFLKPKSAPPPNRRNDVANLWLARGEIVASSWRHCS